MRRKKPVQRIPTYQVPQPAFVEIKRLARKSSTARRLLEHLRPARRKVAGG
jgi:hypothetical protein